MIDVALVAGARPNFIKVGALERAFRNHDGLRPFIIHTGQHYDAKMSDVFFRQLGLPEPEIYLGIGSGTHAEQTARVMTEIEKVFMERKPDVVLVVGDVNSTMAAALTAQKLHIPVVHVEAGLRSGDREMPEEINRLVTDAISDMLYVSEPSGLEHLRAEGQPEEKMLHVGNVMIDSLRRFEEAAAETAYHEKLGLEAGSYVLITAHRPALVDDPDNLSVFVRALERISELGPIVFPVHPRTLSRLRDTGLAERLEQRENIHLTEPIGYLEFLCLMMKAGLVLTDSGGIQEETTALGVPCATVRPNTERPATIDTGTNELVELDVDVLVDAARRAFSGQWKSGRIPDLWDGHAAERIADDLARRFGG